MTLSVKDVSLGKRLSGVTLALEPGTVTAICGPNGAGKSSLLEVMAGLLKPDTGETLLRDLLPGRDNPRERARRIGYLPQSPEIAWDVPVRGLIELGRMPHGDRAKGPVDAAIDALDLRPFAQRRVLTLSGGETARVLLARILAGEPDWILADEPLAALDLAHQRIIMRHLVSEARRGRGVALVLHDLAIALNHADRVVLLDRGAIVADGPPSEALSRESIERVFGVRSEWVGPPGRRALSV
ncbi:MAG: ABC transporter ATP-binding protein [Pseudomonadota bacterium]|jgi:iron complex transport system ATP-binding protein|nr:ABC transporter ATP-binding protein [Pseudomonadota bacterium]